MAYTDIDKPSDYFNTKLYTGNNSTLAVTGVGFQPDWVWIKNRDSAVDHALFDIIRGGDNRLESNTTDAEATNPDGITSFDSDGFTLSNGSSRWNGLSDYASWNWLASNTTASNTDGSITSTVSASTVSGFSIVTWTSLASGSNYTVGHGLGSTPAVIIMKGRHESNSWIVYHHKNTSAPETDYLELNTTVATADYPIFNDTAPTSSVFTCGTWSGFDAGGTMVAYCFAEKKGFSKFGSYTGNGNADGTFVYTGFKPAFVMAKKTNATDGWSMWDNKRDIDNLGHHRVFAESSAVESTSIVDTTSQIDLYSNGFKWRGSSNDTNGSGDTYIYMAFASNPFVTSTGVPTTAR